LSDVDDAALLLISDRWWNEIWRDGNVAAADELLTDPFVRHSATGTSVAARNDYKEMLSEFQRTLCRPQTTIDARVVAGGLIWTRATSRGLNRATGETTVVTWMIIQRISEGRIAEHWTLTVRGVDWSA
jgi:predicted SnoaL-like aldol condensation-catalyzing enzyme